MIHTHYLSVIFC